MNFNPWKEQGLKEREYAHKKLDAFNDFSDGWDGYDAFPISEIIIEKAHNILDQLASVPFICATPDGTIQFEWENNKGYLEIEITEDTNLRLSCTGISESANGGIWRSISAVPETILYIVEDFLTRIEILKDNPLQRSYKTYAD